MRVSLSLLVLLGVLLCPDLDILALLCGVSGLTADELRLIVASPVAGRLNCSFGAWASFGVTWLGVGDLDLFLDGDAVLL